jgi:hypothetical protein
VTFLTGLDPVLVLALFVIALAIVIAGVAITSWWSSRGKKPPDDGDGKGE